MGLYLNLVGLMDKYVHLIDPPVVMDVLLHLPMPSSTCLSAVCPTTKEDGEDEAAFAGDGSGDPDGLVSEALWINGQSCVPDQPARGGGWHAAPVVVVFRLHVRPSTKQDRENEAAIIGNGSGDIDGLVS